MINLKKIIFKLLQFYKMLLEKIKILDKLIIIQAFCMKMVFPILFSTIILGFGVTLDMKIAINYYIKAT